METMKTTLPQRTTEQLNQQGGQLLMQCYEIENSTNCYGHIPRRTSAPDYLRAKRKAHSHRGEKNSYVIEEEDVIHLNVLNQ